MTSLPPPSTRVLRLAPSLLALLLWALVGAVNLAMSLIPPVQWPDPIKITITCLCGVALSLGVAYAAERASTRALTGAAMAIAAPVLLAATALWAIDVVVQGWTIDSPLADHATVEAFLLRRYNWVYFAILFSLQGAISALIASVQTLQTRERQLTEAKLRALRLQLNPHFLFNTLNAVSTLVAEAGADQAGTMIARLSDFMRISLAAEPAELVPLGSELEFVQAYLDIESVRFGDRLQVQYECGPGLSEAQVPSMILQPLVENAVKYSVAPSSRSVTVAVQAHAEAMELVLTVVDDGALEPARKVSPGTGLGLRNVAARLEALYGPAGRLTAGPRGRGFAAAIRMPLRHPAPGQP